MATTTTTTSTISRKRVFQQETKLKNRRWKRLAESEQRGQRFQQLSRIIEADTDWPKIIKESPKNITLRKLEIVKVPAETEERPVELERMRPSVNFPWLNERPQARTAEELGYYPHQDFAPANGISSVPDPDRIHDPIWVLRIVFVEEKVKKKKKRKFKSKAGSNDRPGLARSEVIQPLLEGSADGGDNGNIVEDVKTNDENVPDTMDDNVVGTDAAVLELGERMRGLAATPVVQTNPNDVEDQGKDEPMEELVEPEKSPLLKLPLEIRLLICEYLLTRQRPRRLHDNWRRVWKNRGRDRLPLDVEILRTCNRIYQEALPVLYGCNTFQYLIRDAGNGVETNGEHPVFGTEEHVEEAESEWEADEAARIRGRRRRRRGNDAPEFDIETYGHLIRNISIVAESGRDEKAVLVRMTEAVGAFEASKYLDNNRRLDTLTICVEPTSKEVSSVEGNGNMTGGAVVGSQNADDDESKKSQVKNYSFVNFFDSDSALLDAVRRVDCRYFRLNIRRKSLPQTLWSRAQVEAEADVASFTIDMRARRIFLKALLGGDVLWSGDTLRIPTLRLKGQAIRQSLQLLREYFMLACTHGDGTVDRELRLKAGAAMLSRATEDSPVQLSLPQLVHIVYNEPQRNKTAQKVRSEGPKGNCDHVETAAMDGETEVGLTEKLTLARSMIQARFNYF